MGVFEHFPYTNFHDLNLNWIIKLMKAFDAELDGFKEWKEQHENEYQQLKDLYDDLMAGNFPYSIQAAFASWMQENAIDLVGNLVKMVFFGLTDSGYFVAYIPDGWEDIIFNTTDYDIDVALMPEYGHLVLSY